MEALVWTAAGKLQLQEIGEPQLQGPHEVRIEIRYAGICGTDLAVVAGKEHGVPGIIRGHEAVGIVLEIGEDVTRVKPGDRVVIDPNLSCGSCYYCRRDQPHLCEGEDGAGMPIAGLNVQGTFASTYISHERFVHRLPEGMSWEAAVLVEPLACVLHNLKEAQVRADDTVLVLGAGPMGLLCLLAAARQARLTVATEVQPYRLEWASRLADAAVHPDELDQALLDRLNGGRKFDVVIDTVGTQLAAAEQWVDRGGRIVPFGINAVYTHTIKPVTLIQRAVKIIGAGEYRHMFEQALQMAATMPELQQLVTRKCKLSAHEEAIEELLGYRLNSGERVVCNTIKTVFVP